MAVSLENYLSHVRIPSPADKVYKAECCYSFDTPVCVGIKYGLTLVIIIAPFTSIRYLLYFYFE